MSAVPAARNQNVPGAKELTPTDAEVLRRSGAGDTQHFEQFVARHEAAVLRYLRALAVDPSVADDAFQETFLAAWRHAGDFRGGSSRAWLLTIARNALGRYSRRRAGQPDIHLPIDELGRHAGWGSEARDALDEQLARREVVRMGFEGLTIEDREVIILCDAEGFSGQEVAAILDLSVAAVKSRLHRARLRFVANVRGGERHGQ